MPAIKAHKCPRRTNDPERMPMSGRSKIKATRVTDISGNPRMVLIRKKSPTNPLTIRDQPKTRLLLRIMILNMVYGLK